MSFYHDIIIICRENERAGQAGEKKIFPAGTARALEGARLPVENIFFHILLTLEAGIFPLAGKLAFFPAERLSLHCLAGKTAFFAAERLSKHCSGREISLFSGRTPLAALLWPGNQPFFRPNTSRSTALAGRTRGLGDGRAEYHKGRRFLALVTVKTYFCLSVYHLNYV